MKNTCKHTKTKNDERVYCFTAPVAVYPYTEENRAAHGNICYDEICCECGATRAVLQNGSHYEFAPWGPSAAELKRREEEKKERAREAAEKLEDAAMQARDAKVVEVTPKREGYSKMVVIKMGGERKAVALYKIKEAAAQKDDGDGLVPFYRAVMRHAQEWERKEEDKYARSY